EPVEADAHFLFRSRLPPAPKEQRSAPYSLDAAPSASTTVHPTHASHNNKAPSSAASAPLREPHMSPTSAVHHDPITLPWHHANGGPSENPHASHATTRRLLRRAAQALTPRQDPPRPPPLAPRRTHPPHPPLLPHPRLRGVARCVI